MQHWPMTFELVAVQWSLYHRDFEMCIRLMVAVDGLFHMPLKLCADDLKM